MSIEANGLAIRDVTVRYGRNTVLESLNMDVVGGRITGLIGPNGAGKTTLLDTLYGLVGTEGGTTSWNGSPLLRSSVGYLESENYFYPMITGREYLELFRLQNRDFDISGWSEVFDLPLDQFVDTYSLGMKKKLALLGVLALNRPILILDEPFNHLDIETNHLLQSILRKLAASGKTILLTSHILASLTELCHDILFLIEGKIGASFSETEFDGITAWLESVQHKDRMSLASKLLADGQENNLL